MADDKAPDVTPVEAAVEKSLAPSTETEFDAGAAAALTPPEYEADGVVARPSGWMYRQRKLLFWTIPWYASPKIQLGMVAFVCFTCPGMFNALSGLGGGGKTNFTLADNMVGAVPIAINIPFKPAFLYLCISCSNHHVEYRSVFNFCRFRLFWWHLRQPIGRKIYPGFRRHWILYLCHLFAGLRPQKCRGLQHLRRCVARCLRRSPVDRPGHHHDLLPERG